MALDDQEMLALLAPEYRRYMEWLRSLGRPPLDQLSVEEARDFMRQLQGAGLAGHAVTTERHTVDEFSVVIVRPAGVDGSLPAIVYYHGGGWVLGDFDTHARMVAEIAVRSRSTIVFVEYARAPEARFPVALEQCYRALAWAAAQGASAGLDAARLIVAGDSAGGTLAAAVALLAARRGGPQIQLQALLYPVMDCDFTTSSYRDFEAGLNLDRAAMRWFWDHYLPDSARRSDPLASPLRASRAELAKMPPALVITAECDVLREEGEAFARKLANAGVAVGAARFPGTLHAFMMIDDLAQSAQARAAMDLLRWQIARAAGDASEANRE